MKGEGEKTKRPGAPLMWTEKCQVVFDELKRRFTTEPVLKHVDPDKPCVIQVDSSDVAMGAVILHRDGKGCLHPIAFLSKKFLEMEGNWAIWEKGSGCNQTGALHLETLVRGFAPPVRGLVRQ